MILTLIVLDETFAIHRLAPDAGVPDGVFSAEFVAVTKSAEELSIVAPESLHLDGGHVSGGWRALKVLGPLDFALTGILAGLATALANAGVSIFAVSTYDTDYVLVKQETLDAAIAALLDAGYQLEA